MKIGNTKNLPEKNLGATKSETAPMRRTRKDFVNIKKLLQNEGVLILIIVSLLVILVFFKFNPLSFKSNELASAEIIVLNGCKECFDINKIIQSLEDQGNLDIKDIKNLNYDSKEGKSIIKKYEVKKIPALILKSRKIEEINIGVPENIISKGKNYILFEETAPYLDLNSGEVKGVVNFVEIRDGSCVDCGSFSSFVKNIESAGIVKENYEIIDSSSEKGKRLIDEKNINFLPSLLISKDVKEYWWIFSSIKNNAVEYEDYYLITSRVYPYKDLASREIKGKVNLNYIVDKNCKSCFDPVLLKEAFQKAGVYINSEKEIDISSAEGRKIIEKYNITIVPTVMLSKEISDYQTLIASLNQVGTIEKDGVFILRKIKEINENYKEI